MSVRGDDLIAIDTNALVHWVRQDSTGRQLLQRYALDQRAERPVLSTIVDGEIRGLAPVGTGGRPNLNASMRFSGSLSESMRATRI